MEDTRRELEEKLKKHWGTILKSLLEKNKYYYRDEDGLAVTYFQSQNPLRIIRNLKLQEVRLDNITPETGEKYHVEATLTLIAELLKYSNELMMLHRDHLVKIRLKLTYSQERDNVDTFSVIATSNLLRAPTGIPEISSLFYTPPTKFGSFYSEV
jgi:hypothetical protein